MLFKDIQKDILNQCGSQTKQMHKLNLDQNPLGFDLLDSTLNIKEQALVGRGNTSLPVSTKSDSGLLWKCQKPLTYPSRKTI